jgi:hypothetical protein
MAIGFLLVGPVPFITTLIPTTGLIQGSSAILGTGYAMIMVSTFGRSQSAAIRNGYNDDLDTYMFISSKLNFFYLVYVRVCSYFDLISLIILFLDQIMSYHEICFICFLGMWSFSFFLGNFLGPTLSGIFVEKYGFRSTTLFFFVVYSLNILIDSAELTYNVQVSKKKLKTDYEVME